MTEDESCISEKKALLQECLPGVTLPNGHGYYHQRRPSDLSSHHTQEIEQLQQQILLSNAMNKMSNDDDIEFSTAYSSISSKRDPNIPNTDEESSSIKILWIDKESYLGSYSDDDELDDIASYSVSIRRAAAVSEAKRRTEERWAFCFKCLFAVACLCILWDEFQATQRDNSTVRVRSTDVDNHKFKFRRFWTKKVDLMHIDDDERKIIIALKDLDEAINGDIVLRSNKTKFLDAARVWQRTDYTILQPSSPEQKISPIAVVEAKSVHDVQLAVPILGGMNRDFGLHFRVRSGGYAYMSGYSSISGGVMLSLAKLNSISINDHENYETNIDVRSNETKKTFFGYNNETGKMKGSNIKTITMEPGVRTEDFMTGVLYEHGFSGVVASAAGVGMGGFVLGGGYGLQSRMYGLAIDNVRSLNIVLPSGETKKVKEGDDLFWALRGAGGGKIAVVTSIEYEVYPSHDIKFVASVKVSLLEMTHFLQRLGEMESNLAPEFTLRVEKYTTTSSTVTSLSQRAPWESYVLNTTIDENEEDGHVTILMYWMGDSNPDDPIGMKFIKNEIVPLFSNNSIADIISYYYFSWTGLSREREQNPELRSVWSAQSWNGFLLPQNNTQEVWTDIQSSLSAMFKYCNFVKPKIELWGGAISKIPSNATAFPHRNSLYNVGVDLVVSSEHDIDAALDEMHLVNAIWPSIARHLDGVNVNYPMSSLSNESYPVAYWGQNLDRLVKLTERYDPSHVLKTSQEVPTEKKNDTSSSMH